MTPGVTQTVAVVFGAGDDALLIFLGSRGTALTAVIPEEFRYCGLLIGHRTGRVTARPQPDMDSHRLLLKALPEFTLRVFGDAVVDSGDAVAWLDKLWELPDPRKF
jgi:hypothetical protein